MYVFPAWVSHLSDIAPDNSAPMRTPAMNAVEANSTRKSQPQTKLNYTQNACTYMIILQSLHRPLCEELLDING